MKVLMEDQSLKKIIIIQPALPSYRIDFFERLAKKYGSNLKVYFSSSNLGQFSHVTSDKWAIQLHPIKFFLKGKLAWQPQVSNIKFTKHDIIVLSGNPRVLSTIILLIKAKIKGASIIWWSHYQSSTTRRWRQLIRFLPMSLSDFILFYTDNEIIQFQEDRWAFKKNKKIGALNNGINISNIEPLKKDYSFEERSNSLLFIGRLTCKAKLHLALQAMHMLGDHSPILEVIGSGEEESYLRELTNKLKLSHKVNWHGAITDEVDIAKIANQCKAFIYPGEVGLSLIHAMAYGLPPIIHDTKYKHMPEVAAFEQNINGLSFKMDNYKSLGETIKLLMQDTNLNYLSNNAYKNISENFTTEIMAKRFFNIVDSLI